MPGPITDWWPDDVLDRVRHLLADATTGLNPRAAALGLPTIRLFTLGPPTLVEDNQFPVCAVQGEAATVAQVAGRIFEPTYSAEVAVGFKQRRTQVAYRDGMRLAKVAMQVMLENDVQPPYWRYLMRGGCSIRPAYDAESGWQGGLLAFTLIGDGVTWT